jgi:hypothetical protein
LDSWRQLAFLNVSRLAMVMICALWCARVVRIGGGSRLGVQLSLRKSVC